MAVGLLLLVAAVAANEMRMLIDHFDVDHNGHLDCVELGYWQDAIHPDQRGGGGGCHVPTMDGDHVLALIGDDAEPVLNGSHPVEIHTSLASEFRLSVIWATQIPTPTSTVKVTCDNGTTFDVLGSNRTYHVGDWQGVIHEAIFELLPNQVITYRVGSHLAWSRNFTLLMPPALGEIRSDRAIRVATFGDMGTYIPLGYQVCEEIAADAKEKPLDLVIHQGDLAYASTAVSLDDDHDLVGEELQFVWDLFGRQIQPVAAKTPYLTPPGNHERFNNWSAYATRFRNPTPWHVDPANLDDSVFWFSLKFGVLSIIAMSTEHDYSPGSKQYIWLTEQLQQAAAEREKYPWIIFIGHRPMYCSDTPEWDQHRPGATFQQTIEPLMLEYGVDLYLCGHMHMYERVHPNRNGTVLQQGNIYTNPNAPVHVVQGNAGIYENTNFITPKPAWSAFRRGEIGYGRFEANKTHLVYESLHLQTRDAVDVFTIIKS